jgi:type IX secretion system PorP/SprF family membrane protein
MSFTKSSPQRSKPIRWSQPAGFILLTALTFFFIKTPLQAQQLPIFTQYREAQGIINPAFISSDYMLNGHKTSMGASYRTQFSGIKRAPKTAILRGEYVFENDNFFKPHLGGFILNDQTSTIGTTGMYAKIAALGTFDPRYGGFSIGLMAGVTRFNFNATDIAWHETGDILSQQNINKIYPDIGLGAFGYLSLSGKKQFLFGEGSDNILYGGFSIPQVFSPTLLFSGNNKDITFQRLPHFYAQMGYYKFVNKVSFWEPSIWINYVKNVSPRIDFNLRYHIKNIFWLGGGYSSNNMVHAETGFWLNNAFNLKDQKIKLCYAFDYGLGNSSSFLGMAHELHLFFLR